MPLHDVIGRTITSLRVSITDRCNLRCRYCMPETGVAAVPHAEILRYEEIERIIRVALALGIAKVRLTGGEPLVRNGVLDFLDRLGQLERLTTLTLTTNGVLLAEALDRLRNTTVSSINISLDTLDRRKFQALTRHDSLDAVLRGIRATADAGFATVKVNVVSLRGFNDDEILDFVEFADAQNVTVRFIEYMPFAGNGWQQGQFLPTEEVVQRIVQRYELHPLAGTDPSAAARTYRIAGKRGKIGFISPVSQPFCGVCNRLRLTADGFLRPCLHGPLEIDVKTPLRGGASDAELAALFQEAVAKKPASHDNFAPPAGTPDSAGRAMHRIGG